jgi:hypothetical protein
MRALTCAALIIGAGLAATSAIADPEVRAGEYNVKGTNFDGSAYSGTAHIAITSNSTCAITWKTGGSTAEGICMRDADSFTAAYRMGDAVGLVLYKINDDGSLDGYWTIAGKSGAGTETLTPQ